MKILYLVRHGIAEEAEGKMKDEERELTEKGRKKFEKGARGLVTFVGKEAIGAVLTSPLVRARQTAEILASVIAEKGGEAQVAITTALGSHADLAALLKMVRQLPAGNGGVAAVGHEPTLSGWVAELCCGGEGAVEMKKGAVAAIELADSGARGTLLWLMPPGALREMG
jgi:phosphohistidine phosphatase